MSCPHMVERIVETKGPYVDEENGKIYYLDTYQCIDCGKTREAACYVEDEE